MQWLGGGFKITLPPEFLAFIQFVHSMANGKPIIGWGFSWGAKWLIELVREHVGLLFGAVMFAGYPPTKCQYEQRSCAAELIGARDCCICMVHFTSDSSCGVHCYPHWHAEFLRHMAVPYTDRWSTLISLDLPGSHEAGWNYWQHWLLEGSPHLKHWFDALCQTLIIPR